MGLAENRSPCLDAGDPGLNCLIWMLVLQEKKIVVEGCASWLGCILPESGARPVEGRPLQRGD